MTCLCFCKRSKKKSKCCTNYILAVMGLKSKKCKKEEADDEIKTNSMSNASQAKKNTILPVDMHTFENRSKTTKKTTDIVYKKQNIINNNFAIRLENIGNHTNKIVNFNNTNTDLSPNHGKTSILKKINRSEEKYQNDKHAKPISSKDNDQIPSSSTRSKGRLSNKKMDFLSKQNNNNIKRESTKNPEPDLQNGLARQESNISKHSNNSELPNFNKTNEILTQKSAVNFESSTSESKTRKNLGFKRVSILFQNASRK